MINNWWKIKYENEKVFFQWDIVNNDWYENKQLEKIENNKREYYNVHGFRINKSEINKIIKKEEYYYFEIGFFKIMNLFLHTNLLLIKYFL